MPICKTLACRIASGNTCFGCAHKSGKNAFCLCQDLNQDLGHTCTLWTCKTITQSHQIVKSFEAFPLVEASASANKVCIPSLVKWLSRILLPTSYICYVLPARAQDLILIHKTRIRIGKCLKILMAIVNHSNPQFHLMKCDGMMIICATLYIYIPGKVWNCDAMSRSSCFATASRIFSCQPPDESAVAQWEWWVGTAGFLCAALQTLA